VLPVKDGKEPRVQIHSRLAAQSDATLHSRATVGCSVRPALAVLLAGKAKFSKGHELRQGRTPKMRCNDCADIRIAAAYLRADVRLRRCRNVTSCSSCVVGE